MCGDSGFHQHELSKDKNRKVEQIMVIHVIINGIQKKLGFCLVNNIEWRLS